MLVGARERRTTISRMSIDFPPCRLKQKNPEALSMHWLVRCWLMSLRPRASTSMEPSDNSEFFFKESPEPYNYQAPSWSGASVPKTSFSVRTILQQRRPRLEMLGCDICYSQRGIFLWSVFKRDTLCKSSTQGRYMEFVRADTRSSTVKALGNAKTVAYPHEDRLLDKMEGSLGDNLYPHLARRTTDQLVVDWSEDIILLVWFFEVKAATSAISSTSIDVDPCFTGFFFR